MQRTAGRGALAWALVIIVLRSGPSAADSGITRQTIAGAENTDPPAQSLWSNAPSIHALIGGQGGIPGGTSALGQTTSGMSLMFEQPRGDGQTGIAIRYLNEGFLGPQNEPWPLRLRTPLHYRDAFGLLLDYWRPVGRNCRLGAALGPETYFDTTAQSFRWAYGDRHGVGVQGSLLGQCRLSSKLSVELMASRSVDVASFDSTQILMGLVFTPRGVNNLRSGDDQEKAVHDGRVEITGGRIDTDDFDVSHDDGTATWVAYGRTLKGSLGMEISLLRERVASVFDRRGAAIELTAQHAFGAPWFQLFAGAGPYLARSSDYEDGDSATQVNLLISYGIRIFADARFSFVIKLGRVAASAGKNDVDLATIGFDVNVP